MKRITQFILCLVLAVSGYGQGVGGNSVPRTVSGISNALDLISSTQGTVFYRGASGWEALTPGTSGQLLSTQGAAANPIWVTATGGAGDVNGPGASTANAIARYNGTGGTVIKDSAVTIADTTGAMTFGNAGGYIDLGASSLTATAVNTGGLRSANFGLSTVSGGASYFGGALIGVRAGSGAAAVEGARLTNTTTTGSVFLNFNETNSAATPAYLIRYGSTHASKANVLEVDSIGVGAYLNLLPITKVANTTASTGVGTGALQVAGGIYAGAASVFEGAVSVASAAPTSNAILTLYNSNVGASNYGISLTNANPDAKNRNWAIVTNNAAFGDFAVLQSNALGGNPISAGTAKLSLTGTTATFAGAVSVSGTTATWTSGTGSPESVKTAPVGSLYTRTDGGAGTTLYIKESGSGNTGWVAK